MWDISKNETSTPTSLWFYNMPYLNFFPLGITEGKIKIEKEIFKVTVVPFQVWHKLNYFLICQIF
jgi:hypothetical protein